MLPVFCVRRQKWFLCCNTLSPSRRRCIICKRAFFFTRLLVKFFLVSCSSRPRKYAPQNTHQKAFSSRVWRGVVALLLSPSASTCYNLQHAFSRPS